MKATDFYSIMLVYAVIVLVNFLHIGPGICMHKTIIIMVKATNFE